VELRLQPKEDKYYSFEIVNDPRGSTKIEDTTVQTTNVNQPAQYREIRSTTSNTFRFSLQFAQRMGPVVGRFGIKESTGGVGLDLVLLDDRLELVQDLFGFGEVVRPRWRVHLAYAFVKRLWLLGGVDDILSYDRRDYFVGLQLRFNDEDIKKILPFAPGP
jgi:phospholipid/cholesterol/gamma-HCH transport system substrate-binding protein